MILKLITIAVLVATIPCCNGREMKAQAPQSKSENEVRGRKSEVGDQQSLLETKSERSKEMDTKDKIAKTEEEWQHCLTPQQYRILREKGTERPFSGELWDHHGEGMYVCAACGEPLFSSQTKFESGTGWPSFWAPISEKSVEKETDHSYGMRRVEVLCSKCDGHLGHVFDDGPAPTGLRYCMNSAALKFVEKK